MMSIDTANPLENTKILIPNNYALNFGLWCNISREVVEGLTKYPWEERIPRALFRGRATGYSRYFISDDI
jgi:hypothetical protein